MHTVHVFKNESVAVLTFARSSLARDAWHEAMKDPYVNVAVLYTDGEYTNSYTKPN